MDRKEDGGKSKIPASKRVIGDTGYKGESQISIRNMYDSQMVKEFKRRSRAHHEAFNGRIKNFSVLDERFRHGVKKHKSCFEAVCVIVQYDMGNGHPMFNV
jgi:hypothetical protein